MEVTLDFLLYELTVLQTLLRLLMDLLHNWEAQEEEMAKTGIEFMAFAYIAFGEYFHS